MHTDATGARQMLRGITLIAATALGSAWCWWPVIREPSLEFPRWTLLALVALVTALAALLANRLWLPLVGAAVAGSFLGLCFGQAMWPSDDGIANSYAGIAIVIGTLAVLVVSLLAGAAGRAISVTNPTARRVLWTALLGCVALGLVMMGATPPLVARRMARNDQLAAQRLAAMRLAIGPAKAEADGATQSCDAHVLSRRYAGPAFSESDWLRALGGNAVKEDGYIFVVKCAGDGTYKIAALPDRIKGDGTRSVCADDSGKTSNTPVSNEEQWRAAMNEAGLPRCP